MKLREEYKKVSLQYQEISPEKNVFDFERIRLFSIVANSTAIEGSTLTSNEVEQVIDMDITIQGKPMQHHFMVVDNYRAMLHALEEAKKGTPVTPELLKIFNGLNLKNTGSVINVSLGSVDMTQGDFRLMAAKSDKLGYYKEHSKIPSLVDAFCARAQQMMKLEKIATNLVDSFEILKYSYEAHCDLILIHPWADGNKRTSRLFMNYVQAYFDLPLTKVYKEDITPYLEALKIAKDTGDKSSFIAFMFSQHIKTLKEEIVAFKQQFSPPETAKKISVLPKKKKGGMKL